MKEQDDHHVKDVSKYNLLSAGVIVLSTVIFILIFSFDSWNYAICSYIAWSIVVGYLYGTMVLHIPSFMIPNYLARFSINAIVYFLIISFLMSKSYSRGNFNNNRLVLLDLHDKNEGVPKVNYLVDHVFPLLPKIQCTGVLLHLNYDRLIDNEGELMVDLKILASSAAEQGLTLVPLLQRNTIHSTTEKLKEIASVLENAIPKLEAVHLGGDAVDSQFWKHFAVPIVSRLKEKRSSIQVWLWEGTDLTDLEDLDIPKTDIYTTARITSRQRDSIVGSFNFEETLSTTKSDKAKNCHAVIVEPAHRYLPIAIPSLAIHFSITIKGKYVEGLGKKAMKPLGLGKMSIADSRKLLEDASKIKGTFGGAEILQLAARVELDKVNKEEKFALITELQDALKRYVITT